MLEVVQVSLLARNGRNVVRARGVRVRGACGRERARSGARDAPNGAHRWRGASESAWAGAKGAQGGALDFSPVCNTGARACSWRLCSGASDVHRGGSAGSGVLPTTSAGYLRRAGVRRM